MLSNCENPLFEPVSPTFIKFFFCQLGQIGNTAENGRFPCSTYDMRELKNGFIFLDVMFKLHKVK